jgi:hypothetical protein
MKLRIKSFSELENVLLENQRGDGIYLLTPWSRALLEKLTGFADSQEIPRIYGTRKFITVFTSARPLSLS